MIIIRSVILVSVFFILMLLNFSFLSSLDILQLHFKLVNKRISNMNYVFVLALESIQNNNYVSYNRAQLLTKYTEELISVENNLTKNYKNGFPADLGSYRDFYSMVSNGNICVGYKNKTNRNVIMGGTIADFADCTV